jgi:hypothetical protein
MNPRALIDFFRSSPGRFVVFLLCGALVVAWVQGCRQRATPNSLPDAAARPRFLPQSFARKTVPLQTAPVSAPPPAPPAPIPKPPAPPTLPPISLYAAPPEETEPTPPLRYAPFGRLIPCVLIITVDSAHITTPIIGLVTEDVWHAGQLIVPAGVEVHGQAQLDRARERIASQGRWTLVWGDGQELTVSGLALDQEKAPVGESWDLRDGSAGLRGDLLRSDNLSELKLFASQALSAASDSLQDRQPTLLGMQLGPTAKNAALRGAGAVLDLYAQRIAESLARDGIYVRVPAGKRFYLYVTETIDLAQARVAGTRQWPDTRLETAPSPAKLTAPLPIASPFTPLSANPTKP